MAESDSIDVYKSATKLLFLEVGKRFDLKWTFLGFLQQLMCLHLGVSWFSKIKVDRHWASVSSQDAPTRLEDRLRRLCRAEAVKIGIHRGAGDPKLAHDVRDPYR